MASSVNFFDLDIWCDFPSPYHYFRTLYAGAGADVTAVLYSSGYYLVRGKYLPVAGDKEFYALYVSSDDDSSKNTVVLVDERTDDIGTLIDFFVNCVNHHIDSTCTFIACYFEYGKVTYDGVTSVMFVSMMNKAFELFEQEFGQAEGE